MLNYWDIIQVGTPPSIARALLESYRFWQPLGEEVQLGSFRRVNPVPPEDRSAFIYERSWGGGRDKIIFWTDWERFSSGSAYAKEKVIVIYTAKRWVGFLGDVLIHEFGHIYGLHHCKSPFCMMSKWLSPGFHPMLRRLCGDHKRQMAEK